jgi:hypothetical protein
MINFIDKEDLMRWYYNTHRMPDMSAPISPLSQSPQNIIDYSPQWQLQDGIPMQPLPTEPMPTESAPTPVSDKPLVSYSPTLVSDEPFVSYFKRSAGTQGWDLSPITYYNMLYNDSLTGPMPLAPPGEIPDDLKRYDWGPNPWPEYKDAEGFKEEAMQPFKRGPDGIKPVWSWEIGDVENNSSIPPLSGLPIIPISDSITTPLPDSELLVPENLPQEERDYPEHIEPYDHEGFSSYLDSLPPGQHSYESVLEGFTGRKLTPQEESVFDPFPNQPIRNLFGEPEDYTSNMPMIDPREPSPPPNSDGLMGIVGGGIIDPGPVFDMQTAEGYEAYLNSL